MSGMYVFGMVPEHNEEQMPKPAGAPHDDAFDNELVDKPQPYFPADNKDSADKQP